MEKIVQGIPASLHGDLSKKLVAIVLGATDKDAVPTELAKKIIYLWRQDQLASSTGIRTILEAAVMVDVDKTHRILDELGLQQQSDALQRLRL